MNRKRENKRICGLKGQVKKVCHGFHCRVARRSSKGRTIRLSIVSIIGNITMNILGKRVEDSETILYDSGIMGICHYTFVRSIECTAQTATPNVTYGLWLLILYQYWLINSKKFTPTNAKCY